MLLGVTLRWIAIPSKGEYQYFQLLHATETGLSSGRVGLLGSCATFTKENLILSVLQIFAMKSTSNGYQHTSNYLSVVACNAEAVAMATKQKLAYLAIFILII